MLTQDEVIAMEQGTVLLDRNTGRKIKIEAVVGTPTYAGEHTFYAGRAYARVRTKGYDIWTLYAGPAKFPERSPDWEIV